MSIQPAIVIRRTVSNIDALILDSSPQQLEMGQWGFATNDKSLAIRDLSGSFHIIKTSEALLESLLIKEPVSTVGSLKENERTGTLRMVLDLNSYWFKTSTGWKEVSNKLIPGANIQISGNTISATNTIYNDTEVKQQIANEASRAVAAEQNLQTQITNEMTRATYAEGILQGQIDTANDRMDSIENLGHYAGSFPTRANLPTNTSAFSQGITINDFATIRADETNGGVATRYVVSDISDGVITWQYDLSYSADISGKQDKLNGLVTDVVRGDATMASLIAREISENYSPAVTDSILKITGRNSNDSAIIIGNGAYDGQNLTIYGSSYHVVKIGRYLDSREAVATVQTNFEIALYCGFITIVWDATYTAWKEQITLFARNAAKLSAARRLMVKLDNTLTETTFNGSANVLNIQVDGVLPIAKGGTNKTTMTANRILGSNATANAYAEINVSSPLSLSSGNLTIGTVDNAKNASYANLLNKSIDTDLGFTPLSGWTVRKHAIALAINLKLVTLNFYSSQTVPALSAGASQSYSLGTLIEGDRPSNSVYGMVYFSQAANSIGQWLDGYCTVSANGVLTANIRNFFNNTSGATAGAVYGSITYLATQ